MNVTQPLREEHKELLPAIREIENLADLVYKLPWVELEKRLKITLDFLQKKLVPHALAEDQILYPKIDKLANFNKATETMKYDHREIARLTEDLLKSVNDRSRIKGLLYQLSIIVMLHFEKEEEIYLPFLDKTLCEKDAENLFKQMEFAVRKIKAKLN